MFLALVNWHRDDPAACEDFCTKIGGAALADAIRTASVQVLVDVGQMPLPGSDA